MKKLLVAFCVIFVIFVVFMGFFHRESTSHKWKSQNDSIFYDSLKGPWKSYKVEYQEAKVSKKPKWQPGYHPERATDELFIDNISSESLNINLKKIRYKTKRLGKIAYDMDGNEIKGMRPVFIKQSELDR